MFIQVSMMDDRKSVIVFKVSTFKNIATDTYRIFRNNFGFILTQSFLRVIESEKLN